MSLYPLTFRPIFKERVWGGRHLEQLYSKPLPPQVPIGESWEIVDRLPDRSVINNGPLAGKDLHWLLQNHRAELMGAESQGEERFPLLIKILDARQVLSLQVHPPAGRAAELGGEPKTEMWYIAHAEPGAELFVGLKRGVSREEFEKKISNGTVADSFYRIPVRAGDAMYLPSGRVHALGAGLVIFEIQQNSDTTYRVFDWNRLGLDGKSRQLHVAESLASIDFKDFEPGLVKTPWSSIGPIKKRQLVEDPLFNVAVVELPETAKMPAKEGTLQIIGVITGELVIHHSSGIVKLGPGQFSLIPAGAGQVPITASQKSSFLLIEPGKI